MADFLSGVGGTFVFSDQPAALADWYADVFGFQWQAMGDSRYQMFLAADRMDPTKVLDFHFAIMKAKVPLPPVPAPVPEPTEGDAMYGDQPFMVNVRVTDMDAALAHARSRGVAVIRTQDEGYGRFAWVRDPDGRRVEIYQPIPGAFGG
ncbi:MAG: VOC family protein [Myxococcales bacterium]|nr:VOC family protein [Myxococcales bacterium]